MQSPLSLFHFIKELTKSTIVVFVKERNGMSERMSKAYKCFSEFASGADTRRMSLEETLAIRSSALSLNLHIFIIDNFSDEVFNYLNELEGNHYILGVPVLEHLHQLQDGSIKRHSRRIFNCAFNNVVLCISNIKSTEKKEIGKLLKYMNGRLSNTVDSDVTHLITNTTKSVKYLEAASRKIQIYHYQWIHAVWNKCLKENDPNMRADSAKFDIHKLPPFFDLHITCSGLSRERKSEIEVLVDENGGHFSETFKSNETDILLMNEKDGKNLKYQNAIKFKVPILNCSWVEESATAGYSLPYEDFSLKASRSRNSSLLERTVSADTLVSTSTDILQSDSDQFSMYEVNTTEIIATVPKKKTPTDDREEFISKLTLDKVKKLGNFLDGYNIFLFNMAHDASQKIGKVIARCGGNRLEELSEAVSHILLYNESDLKDLQKKIQEHGVNAIVINLDWLIACIKQQKQLPEVNYIVEIALTKNENKNSVPQSPMSKKAISTLHRHVSTNCLQEVFKEKELTDLTNITNFNCEKQLSIEANHRKVKRPLNIAVSLKRRSDEDVNTLKDPKKYKTIDNI